MRSPVTLAAFLLAVAFGTAIVRADMESGPAAGTATPALKLIAATGASAGKEVDFAAERKGHPTFYVFVQADAWDRPVARFLKVLDDGAGKAGNDVEVVVVWLTGEVEKGKEYLPKVQESLKLGRTTFAVYTGATAGPDDWRLHGNANVSVIAARDAKVLGGIGYKSVNEKDVPSAVEKLKPKADEKK
jgi:hypothetical protein